MKKNKKDLLSDRFDGMKEKPQKGFFDTSDVGLTKTISISNEGDTTKRIVVFPGGIRSIDELSKVIGASADLIAKEGKTGDVIVVCDGLAFAQRHFVRNPTRVSQIQVSVNDAKQLSQPIELYKANPLRKTGSVNLIPKLHQSASNGIATMVVVPTNGYQIDDQTCWIVSVAAKCTVDLTFFMGACRNDAYLLQKAGEALER